MMMKEVQIVLIVTRRWIRITCRNEMVCVCVCVYGSIFQIMGNQCYECQHCTSKDACVFSGGKCLPKRWTAGYSCVKAVMFCPLSFPQGFPLSDFVICQCWFYLT